MHFSDEHFASEQRFAVWIWSCRSWSHGCVVASHLRNCLVGRLTCLSRPLTAVRSDKDAARPVKSGVSLCLPLSCLSLCLSVCLSRFVSLSLCLSFCLCLSFSLSLSLCLSLSVCLPLPVSLSLSLCLSAVSRTKKRKAANFGMPRSEIKYNVIRSAWRLSQGRTVIELHDLAVGYFESNILVGSVLAISMPWSEFECNVCNRGGLTQEQSWSFCGRLSTSYSCSTEISLWLPSSLLTGMLLTLVCL